MPAFAYYHNRILFLVVMVFLALNSGCKKDDGVTDVPDPVVIPTPPTVTEFGGIHPTSILAVVRVSTEIPGLPFLLDATTASAQFGNPGLDKGNVKATVGSSEYVFTKNTAGSSVSYSLTPSQAYPQGIQLSGGATDLSFNATNYLLSDSVVTVPGQLKVTAPINNATIQRSQNLNVTWTVAGPGDQAAVYITDGAGHSKFYQALGNVVSFTIPSVDLLTLNQGPGYVYAISYNFRLSNSNEAVLIGEATFLRTFELR